jgi:hypothetical protein
MPNRLFRLFFGDLAFLRVVTFSSGKDKEKDGILEAVPEGEPTLVWTAIGKEDFGEEVVSGGEANNDCKVSTLSGLNLPTVLFSFKGVVSCSEVMLNFYHRFMPHIAEILVPLTLLLSGL